MTVLNDSTVQNTNTEGSAQNENEYGGVNSSKNYFLLKINNYFHSVMFAHSKQKLLNRICQVPIKRNILN